MQVTFISLVFFLLPLIPLSSNAAYSSSTGGQSQDSVYRKIEDFPYLSDFESVRSFENYIDDYEQECIDKTYGNTKAIPCFVAYELWDRELNKYYQILMSKLPKKQQEALRSSQRLWLRNRDRSIEFNSALLDRKYDQADGAMYSAMRANDSASVIPPIIKQRALLVRKWAQMVEEEALASKAAENCSGTQVEMLICNDDDVAGLEKELNRIRQNISCDAQLQQEFAAEQRFWVRERNQCRFQEDVKACLVETFKERIEFLDNFSSCAESNGMTKYEYTDPWYIIENPELYIDEKVHVFGWVSLDGCGQESRILTGKIVSPSLSPFEGAIDARFERLDNSRRSFLCDKSPLTHWEGVIEVADDHPVLKIEEHR